MQDVVFNHLASRAKEVQEIYQKSRFLTLPTGQADMGRVFFEGLFKPIFN